MKLYVVKLLVGAPSFLYYSGFEVTCPDCDLKSALDYAARDKKRHTSYEECSRNSNFEYIMTNYDDV